MPYVRCPSCGRNVSERASYCPFCEEPVDQRMRSIEYGKVVCPKCHRHFDPVPEGLGVVGAGFVALFALAVAAGGFHAVSLFYGQLIGVIAALAGAWIGYGIAAFLFSGDKTTKCPECGRDLRIKKLRPAVH